MFQNHEQHKRIIYNDIFFINGKDENDHEINRLKTKLVDVAFRQKSWGKECLWLGEQKKKDKSLKLNKAYLQ
jgi:hypothetical protein